MHAIISDIAAVIWLLNLKENKKMKKATLILGLMVLSVTGVFAQAKMTFDNEVLDYGTIVEKTDGNRVFKFKNEGTEPLIITEAKGSCGCTTPDAPLNKPFLPGEGGEIKVHYDTKRIGTFKKNVTLTTNAGVYTLEIKGNVEPLPVDEAKPGSGAQLKD